MNREADVEWELRPGGMLVQRRDDGDSNGGAADGDLKRFLVQEAGLEPKDQRHLFRGKKMEDEEFLQQVGVKDRSKSLHLEKMASKERKLEGAGKSHEISKPCKAVAEIRTEIDELSEKAVALEVTVNGGTTVEDKQFVVLTELLMRQLLKLDSIEAGGEAKEQRRAEVHRVQHLLEVLDNLKARNSNPFSVRSNVVPVFGEKSQLGRLTSTPPKPSSAAVYQDWEMFD